MPCFQRGELVLPQASGELGLQDRVRSGRSAAQVRVGDRRQRVAQRLQDVLDGADPQPSIQSLARLGQTTAALHVALAQPGGGPDFDPEIIDEVDVEAQVTDLSTA